MNNRSRARCVLAASAALLVGCSDDGGPGADAEPAAEASSATVSSAPPDSTSADYTLLLDDDADPDQVQDKPGAFAMTARGATQPPLAVVDVPPGYANFGAFALWLGEDNKGPFRALSYWTVYAVHDDPCGPVNDTMPIGDSVEDLTDALLDQKATRTTRPEPVSLDGHDGLYLEITTSADLDFEKCETGYFMLWDGKPNDAQHTAESPGLVDRLWILDVDGGTVVLSAASASGVTAVQSKELTAMVESVRFVDSA